VVDGEGGYCEKGECTCAEFDPCDEMEEPPEVDDR